MKSEEREGGLGMSLAKLVVTGGPLTGCEFFLDGEATSIGRRTNNTIVVPDPAVSRTHGVIKPLGDGSWAFYDSGSENGSLVNGSRVSYRVLADGDEIRMGNTVFRAHVAVLATAGPGPDRLPHPAESPRFDAPRFDAPSSDLGLGRLSAGVSAMNGSTPVPPDDWPPAGPLESITSPSFSNLPPLVAHAVAGNGSGAYHAVEPASAGSLLTSVAEPSAEIAPAALAAPPLEMPPWGYDPVVAQPALELRRLDAIRNPFVQLDRMTVMSPEMALAFRELSQVGRLLLQTHDLTHAASLVMEAMAVDLQLTQCEIHVNGEEGIYHIWTAPGAPAGDEKIRTRLMETAREETTAVLATSTGSSTVQHAAVYSLLGSPAVLYAERLGNEPIGDLSGYLMLAVADLFSAAVFQRQNR